MSAANVGARLKSSAPERLAGFDRVTMLASPQRHDLHLGHRAMRAA
jgi:hypothetical protein